MKQLELEKVYQQKHVEYALEKLRKKPKKWVRGSGSCEKTVEMFLQYCIVPRAVRSPEDAYYCAQFVRVLHDTSTPFGRARYFDLVERCVPVPRILFNGARGLNLGLFLSETFGTITNGCRKKSF